MKNKFIVLSLLMGICGIMQAQILLNNPSFEDIPKDAKNPKGWNGCGMYTTPDILPAINEFGEPVWDVTNKAVDGKTFIGLITREDNTWEYISQRLPTTMAKNDCYLFNIDLARSPYYAGYNVPIRLRIWGGTNLCTKSELLYESDAVEHYEWKNYEVLFFPKEDYNYIIFEATYAKGTVWPYRGNLLMDNASAIRVCDRASLY